MSETFKIARKNMVLNQLRPNKINEENKIKDIEKTKKELSSDSEIKDFLDEFEGEIEAVTKIKN